MKKKTTVNQGALVDASNYTFVRGSITGRKAAAKALASVFRFNGGYRAAYQAVKHGYYFNNCYAGPANTGGYVFNCYY